MIGQEDINLLVLQEFPESKSFNKTVYTIDPLDPKPKQPAAKRFDQLFRGFSFALKTDNRYVVFVFIQASGVSSLEARIT